MGTARKPPGGARELQELVKEITDPVDEYWSVAVWHRRAFAALNRLMGSDSIWSQEFNALADNLVLPDPSVAESWDVHEFEERFRRATGVLMAAAEDLQSIGTIPNAALNPHRPLTPVEVERREKLAAYLDKCSEDELIEDVLLPLFRQLGYHRITAARHKNKALEYGKDIWMRYTLPTQHHLYFGIQVKRGKLDASGATRASNTNIAEIHNQALMMLAHDIFDPERNRRVLVDHAFIVAGGEITKAARNWLGNALDASRRSQIMFIDRNDILNLYTITNLPLPNAARPPIDPRSTFSDEPCRVPKVHHMS